MGKLRDRGSVVLFKGQRLARLSHWCQHCQREICPNEYFWVKVSIVLVDPDAGVKEIVIRKSCCQEV